MVRTATLSAITLVLVVSTVSAQDGVLSRTGQALDNVGRGIRNAVDNGIAQGQIDAEDREVLNRVMRRVEWDKHLVGSTIRIEVQPGRTVVLRGSVASPIHKKRAAELVASTVGVGSVVDQLAVVKEVKVISATPSARIIEVTPPAPTPPAATIIEVTPPVPTPPVPTDTTVIVKP
jgi:hyperosmotically inducible periplasmic protein